MPVNLYVCPREGLPHWWKATDHDGLSFSGSFPWALAPVPPDDLRDAGNRLCFGEEVATWRPAGRDEAVCLVWDANITREGL